MHENLMGLKFHITFLFITTTIVENKNPQNSLSKAVKKLF